MVSRPQDKVAQAVAERGYRDGYAREEFIARNVAKLVEELREMLDYVWAAGRHQAADTWEDHLVIAGNLARRAFDDGDFSNADITSGDGARQELADVQVVVFCLADALDFDVAQAAVEKANEDIERGKR